MLVQAFVQPARHLILPEGEGELLAYDCLLFDGSDYRLKLLILLHML